MPVPTRHRKVRKLRGSRTHGWGVVGQHRKHGMHGGRGRAGLHKHKVQWMLKYMPDHFGKDPMKPPTSRPVRRWLNVGQLDDLYARVGSGGQLDLRGLGYEKLLGAGSVRGSYTITVDSYSARAKEKVEAAGGRIVT